MPEDEKASLVSYEQHQSSSVHTLHMISVRAQPHQTTHQGLAQARTLTQTARIGTAKPAAMPAAADHELADKDMPQDQVPKHEDDMIP
jgi:hypothetical protein